MAVVRVDGAARLQRTMRDAGRRLTRLRPAHRTAAQTISTAAARNAPRRTGRLAGSLTPTAGDDLATVASNQPSAGVIHWGWPGHNITANPFLTQAAEATEPRWFGVYVDVLGQALHDIKGL